MVVVGAIDPDKSSYFKFTELPAEELHDVIQNKNAAGEITSTLYDTEGKPCALEYSNRVVGLTLDEVRAIPQTIGVAALQSKTKPVAAALKGGLLDTLIIDELTALSVIALLEVGW
ncbi:MAG: sugar-binding domain-containing protein [Bacteroidota bacterium]